MNKTFIPDNDGIDLVKFFTLLWNGRLGIVLALIVSISFAIFYQNTRPPKIYTATTKVKAVNSTEANKYKYLNQAINLNEQFEKELSRERRYTYKNFSSFQEITQYSLLDLYFEVLEERKLFEEGIKKYKFLDVNKFKNKQLYEEAVSKLASSIKVNTPNQMEIIFKKPYKFGIIKFNTDKNQEWEKLLLYVSEAANQVVKENLNNQLDTYLNLNNQYLKKQIDDLNLEIQNLSDDYDDNIKSRLLFLEEQSLIARELQISSANSELQKSIVGQTNNENNNFTSNEMFYLRGYEAIEKEIELIRLRKPEDKKSFLKGLQEIQKIKRRIEQSNNSQTIRSMHEATPLSKNNEFFAGKIKVQTTTYINKEKNLVLVYSISIGLIFGLIYVFVINQFNRQKKVNEN